MWDCNAIMRNYSRYLLIFFNLLFALTGIIIISVGISAKAYYNEFDDLLNDKYFYVSDLLIIIGIIIFFIAFFGCCGAMKENACMTTTFSALLIVVFILEILVGVGGVLLKHKTEDFLTATLKESMIRYDKNDTEITESWDAVQNQLHCCGVTNASDWITALNTSHGNLPLSCCQIKPGMTGNFTCNLDSSDLYRKPCLDVLGDYIRSNTTAIEVVGLGLGIIQLFGIILSCYLAKQIRSDYETV